MSDSVTANHDPGENPLYLASVVDVYKVALCVARV